MKISLKQWQTTLAIVAGQVKESIDQQAKNITVRMATVTCPCGKPQALVKSYQCLYCKVWFCHGCAETHFGQTMDEYRQKNPIMVAAQQQQAKT